jgi:hypothetical protein
MKVKCIDNSYYEISLIKGKTYDVLQSEHDFYRIVDESEEDYLHSKDFFVIDLKSAHNHAYNNKKEIEKSTICGCFYCCEIFHPDKIKEWIDNEETALCLCGIDSVLGSASGLPVTDKMFLKKMHVYFFGVVSDFEEKDKEQIIEINENGELESLETHKIIEDDNKWKEENGFF